MAFILPWAPPPKTINPGDASDPNVKTLSLSVVQKFSHRLRPRLGSLRVELIEGVWRKKSNTVEPIKRSTCLNEAAYWQSINFVIEFQQYSYLLMLFPDLLSLHSVLSTVYLSFIITILQLEK